MTLLNRYSTYLQGGSQKQFLKSRFLLASSRQSATMIMCLVYVFSYDLKIIQKPPVFPITCCILRSVLSGHRTTKLIWQTRDTPSIR